MPTLQSPDDEQRPLSASPPPKSSGSNNNTQQQQTRTPQQTPQQTTHYQKKDDWPPERLAKLYVIRLQNSKLNWDEFQEKFYPNYHTQVRFKFYEARKLAAKNALPNISPVNLPSNMQPRNRKPRHGLGKFYAESELEDSDTDSEGGDILYQTENTSAAPDIVNPPHTLASKPKPKPASTPSSTPAQKSLGPTSTSTGTGAERRPAKRPRISSSSRPATPSTGADTTATTNRARKLGSSSAVIDTHLPPASAQASVSTPIPAPASFPPHPHPHAHAHAPALTGTPTAATLATAIAPATTPISSNEFGSKIRFDRVNLADWTYIYHLAKACPAERERADALAMRDQDQLRLIAEMQSRMAEMEAEMEEMRRRMRMQEAAALSAIASASAEAMAAAAASAASATSVGVEVGGAEKQGQGQGQGQGQQSLSSALSLLGRDSDPSSMTAAARQVSTTLKSRATELRGLFDGLWKASLKFIPPFQLEEMGMQRASEGIVRKIGEIEWVAEEVGRVRMGMEGGSGSGSGSGNEGVVVDGGERRAGPEFKDGN